MIIKGCKLDKDLKKFHVIIIVSGFNSSFECNKSPHITIKIFYSFNYLIYKYNSSKTY